MEEIISDLVGTSTLKESRVTAEGYFSYWSYLIEWNVQPSKYSYSY